MLEVCAGSAHTLVLLDHGMLLHIGRDAPDVATGVLQELHCDDVTSPLEVVC